MRKLDPSRGVRAAGGVTVERLYGMVLLQHPQGTCYALNEVGARVWELLATHHTLEALVEALAREYDAPRDAIRQDVAAFLEQLYREGFLEAVPVPKASGA